MDVLRLGTSKLKHHVYTNMVSYLLCITGMFCGSSALGIITQNCALETAGTMKVYGSILNYLSEKTVYNMMTYRWDRCDWLKQWKQLSWFI